MRVKSRIVLLILLNTILSIIIKNETKAKVNFSISTGYLCNRYEKTVSTTFGSYLYRDANKDYYLNVFLPKLSMRQINWFYDIDNPATRPIAKKDLAPEDRLQLYDIVGHFLIDGFIHSIPITSMVYWDFSKKFRFGLGTNLNINYIHHLNISRKKVSKALLEKFSSSFVVALKAFLSSKQNATLFKEVFKKIPKDSIWQLEYIHGLLDPVRDKELKDSLKEILDEKNKSIDEGSAEDGTLNKYIPQRRFHFSIEPFVLLGFKFLESADLSGLVDVTVTPVMIVCNSLTNFYVVDNVRPPLTFGAYGLGITLEKHISAYFSAFGRIGYKLYDHIGIKMDSKNEERLPIMYTESWSISIQCGISFCSPNEERCPIYGCGIQVDHLHRARKYRGSNMFTGKDLLKRKIFDGRIS